MNDKLSIQCLRGSEILPFISDLASLRIKIFHDYPYLYDGSLAYEENYLHRYTQCKESVFIVVFSEKGVVGVSTAIPLIYEAKEFQSPFLAANIDIKQIFYFGESVLLPQYRGQGIGKRFFLEREQAAQQCGYNITAFCAVERPTNHPRRPANWHSLDTFWQKMGYKKHPELIAYYPWKDLDEEQESMKPLVFWIKGSIGRGIL